MYKRFLTLFFCLCALKAHAQYGANGIYASNTSTLSTLQLPTVREIVGGTIITPKYEGSGFTPAMRNAFDYACRIWEERIPTAYPINIAVKLANITDVNCLATVNTLYVYMGERGYKERPLNKRQAQTGKDDYSTEFFIEGNDAEITFARNRPFDYNIDETRLNPNKFDFVSVAIQAIGKALGFKLTAHPEDQNLVLNEQKNEFSSYVFNGDTAINLQGFIVQNHYLSCEQCDASWLLYSPSVYNNKYTLNYFSIDSNNNETRFMQPGITKGSAIRYIGKAMDCFFNRCQWDRLIATGYLTTHYQNASTNNVIPFAGITNSNKNMLYRLNKSGREVEDLYTYMSKRSEYRGENGMYVLLKDGSWEKCNDLQQLSDTDKYARTCDGYLRLLNFSKTKSGMSYYQYRFDYSLYKYIPQIPAFSPVGFTSSSNRMGIMQRKHTNISLNERDNEDEYIDVEIQFMKTEGCKNILVEQTDSDWPIPYTYFVEPSSGSFIAYMNKRYPSTFKLTYINDEGSCESQYVTYDFSTEPTRLAESFIVDIKENTLQYELNIDNSFSSGTAYIIRNLVNPNIKQEGKILYSKGDIDISSLPKGIYGIKVYAGGKEFSSKWRK